MSTVYADADKVTSNVPKLNLKGVFLIFDCINSYHNYDKPKNYRTGVNLNPISLNISGSSQPAMQDFEYIIAEAKKFVKVWHNIFIVDLRQEPHALLNEDAISWYGFRNQVSHNRESQLISQLARKKTVKVYEGIDKLEDGYFIPKDSVNVTVHKVNTEQQAVEELGVKYRRFVVKDHFIPENKQIDLFIQFIKDLPEDHWVHFHCRGGKGRTTTFMALYDIIKNAHLLSLEEIVKRQNDLGGIKLSNSFFKEFRKKWKEPSAQIRSSFIKEFYNYVKDPEGFNKQSWSEWIKGR